MGRVDVKVNPTTTSGRQDGGTPAEGQKIVERTNQPHVRRILPVSVCVLNHLRPSLTVVLLLDRVASPRSRRRKARAKCQWKPQNNNATPRTRALGGASIPAVAPASDPANIAAAATVKHALSKVERLLASHHGCNAVDNPLNDHVQGLLVAGVDALRHVR